MKDYYKFIFNIIKLINVYILLLGGCFADTTYIPFHDPKGSHTISFTNSRNFSQGSGELKGSVMQELKNYFGIVSFVESGTFRGDTTYEAMKYFQNVYTIELSSKLYKQAQKRFRKNHNVHVFNGDSGEILNDILPNIDSPILFYLDGHFSGFFFGYDTAKGFLNTPIMQELEAIKNSEKTNSIIIIDDIYLFQNSCYPEKIKNTPLEDFPELSELQNKILEINPEYQICFLGDALLAFPKTPSVTVSSLVSACALHRFSPYETFTEELLKKADADIESATGNEYDELVEYYQRFSSVELQQGFRSYSTLWYAMLLKNAGQLDEAITLFHTAQENSLPNWRVDHFLKD